MRHAANEPGIGTRGGRAFRRACLAAVLLPLALFGVLLAIASVNGWSVRTEPTFWLLIVPTVAGVLGGALWLTWWLDTTVEDDGAGSGCFKGVALTFLWLCALGLAGAFFVSSAFTLHPEHDVEFQGEATVAEVDSFLDVRVLYYEAHGPLFKGREVIGSEWYGSGGFDPFEKDPVPEPKRREYRGSTLIGGSPGKAASAEPSVAPAPSDAPEDAGERPAPVQRSQGGYSFHASGIVVALDPDNSSFMLEVEQSSDDVAKGAHVVADCSYAETSALEFSNLAVGSRVFVRSVQAPASDGAIPVQRYEIAADGPVDVEEAPFARPASSAEVDRAFAESGCAFRVVGTVTSPVAADGSFDLRVDGGEPVAAGVTLRVGVGELRTTLGDADALAEGAKDVTVGFSYWPGGATVDAKALVVGR